MNLLLSVASVFAMNIVSETKLECFYDAWSYYDQLLMVIILPYAFSFLVCLGAICFAWYREKVIFARHPHARKLHYHGLSSQTCHG